ncbi:hypothetical protein ACH5RR_033540 [Cinchona calisaya]|uniref:Uncharacterized protein n=1 Tax=Cinchona calisaya TaxID=153742 RepID=A0ABD2YRJ5_9GENT
MFRSDHQFNLLGISQKNGYSKGFEFDDNGEVDKQNHLIPNDDKWEGAFGSNQVHDGHAAEGQQLQQLKDCACFDDLYFNMEIPPFQSCEGKIEKLVDDDPAAFEGSEHNDAKKEIRPYYAGSLQILKNYRKRFRS